MKNIIAESLGIDSSAIVKAEVVEHIPNTKSVLPPDTLDNNIQIDYEKSREYLHNLMHRMEGVLLSSISVASDTEHPRAYEVSGQLFKVATDITEQLAKLNVTTQKLKGIKSTPTKSSNNITTTNNSIFVGSTSDLSAFLNNKNNDENS